jgi:Protein of unknown function (DUF3253)
MTRRLASRKCFRQGKPMSSQDSADASPAPPPSLETALLAALGRAAGKTLSAPELAQEIAEEDWHDLIMPIRRAAVKLALDGRLIIYRKGKPADPNDFRGVYRLGLPRHD